MLYETLFLPYYLLFLSFILNGVAESTVSTFQVNEEGFHYTTQNNSHSFTHSFTQLRGTRALAHLAYANVELSYVKYVGLGSTTLRLRVSCSYYFPAQVEELSHLSFTHSYNSL